MRKLRLRAPHLSHKITLAPAPYSMVKIPLTKHPDQLVKMTSSQENTASPIAPMRWLHPDVETRFPFLKLIAAESPLGIDRIRNLFNDEPEVDYEKLSELLSLGLYCKDTLKLLYIKITNNESAREDQTIFNDLVCEMEQSRLAFLTTDQDKYRQIRRRKSLWYFLPILTSKMKNNRPELAESNEKKCLLLEFSPKPSMPMSLSDHMGWLTSLVYEFCLPGKIGTSANLSKGMVGQIELRVEISDVACKVAIYWNSNSHDDENHASIMAKCIHKVMEANPAFKDFLQEKDITRFDENGIVEEYNLEAACRKAIEEWDARSARQRERNLNRRAMPPWEQSTPAP